MKKRLLSIDALRGLAALAVVFFHAREMNWIGISAMWQANKLAPDLNAYLGYLTFPVIFGWAAVPLFFVLSGYCIHRPHVAKLSQNPEYRIDLKTYFIRRLWRIYPVLFAALIFTAALDPYTLHYFSNDLKTGDNDAMTLWMNLLCLQGVAAPTYGTNVPLWTLGMEVHFYLFYPLLFWATKRFGPLATVRVVAAISFFTLAILHALKIELTLFLAFWFTWSVGFLVAEHGAERVRLSLRPWRFWIGSALAIACVLTFVGQKDLAEPFFAPAFGVLLLWSISARGEKFWSKRGQLLARVGTVSFSLYAFHYPFLVFLRSWLLDGMQSASIFIPFVATLACLGVGVLMFCLVERWSLKVPEHWNWFRGKRPITRQVL